MARNSLAAIKNADNSKNSLPLTPKSKAGRKAKPASEKASRPITLKFTESELELIEQRSGLVPNATYLKQLLIENTDLFGN